VTRDEVEAAGEIALVGYGITAPERNYNDYADLDVRGKVVAVLPGAPPLFPEDVGNYYSFLFIKQENAYRHGAVAVLYLSTTDNALAWRETLRLARSGYFDLRRAVPRPDAFAFTNAAASGTLFDGGLTRRPVTAIRPALVHGSLASLRQGDCRSAGLVDGPRHTISP
jgi:hypothetical protein